MTAHPPPPTNHCLPPAQVEVTRNYIQGLLAYAESRRRIVATITSRSEMADGVREMGLAMARQAEKDAREITVLLSVASVCAHGEKPEGGGAP